MAVALQFRQFRANPEQVVQLQMESIGKNNTNYCVERFNPSLSIKMMLKIWSKRTKQYFSKEK